MYQKWLPINGTCTYLLQLNKIILKLQVTLATAVNASPQNANIFCQGWLFKISEVFA